MTERLTVVPELKMPIVETPKMVYYLGVGLPKARNSESPFVPRRENYRDYINDPFSLMLQREIAISFFLGHPLLIEGGTSIGKTTTIMKMAAELGWEVHYINLHGATDVEDLMGRYVPNPNKRTVEEPEFIFVDGKVTSGLRQEEGKIKIIILDEVNSAPPNILIRLHEVLDALDRGEAVVLLEDASETIPVDKGKTKVAALMNPPGKGYLGRQPLDPALLRRFVYIKLPTDLPEATFSYATDALFGLAPQTRFVSPEAFLFSRKQALLPEQLTEIPGIEEIVAKYKEFHMAVKELARERIIGADQPQPLNFDDRTMPRHVWEFVCGFYNGDITQTIQAALWYYYANKLESPRDRDKIGELISSVECIPPPNVSPRRGYKRGITTPAETRKQMQEAMIRSEKEAWRRVLGRDIEIASLPPVVTPDVVDNLNHLGFELLFIPGLDIGTIDSLKSIEKYLKKLERCNPGWRRFESLSDIERRDHSVSRNLGELYWRRVKCGDIPFPSLPGVWAAVETMPKPPFGSRYKRRAITNMLGLYDRFNVSWDEAQAAIRKAKLKILSAAGLPDYLEVRMLEALEWNLLANRFGWGATDTSEWTNTIYNTFAPDISYVIIGNSKHGGAAAIDSYHSKNRFDSIGFRLAIFFWFVTS